MKKILVTGATGLIGRHLCASLEKSAELYLLVRSPGPAHPNIHYIVHDLGKAAPLPDLPEQIDAVIHLAQSEHFREFPEQVADVFQVNTVTTLNLLDYARRASASSFLFASSGVVYGGQGSFSEEDEIRVSTEQLGFYHTSKLCAEAVAENYANLMNVQILRFFFVYGPGQNQSMLIPRLIDSVKEHRPIRLEGEEGLSINPVFVGDAVLAIESALDLQGSHKINVAGPQVMSLRDVGESIGNALGSRPLFEVQGSAEKKQMVADISKMTALLGAPATSFAEGVQRCVGVVT